MGGGENDLGWFSPDEGDNQQERFASYLIAAVQQATGGHCAASEAMVQKRQYASLPSSSHNCLLNWPTGSARCSW